jgi:hypothetical protein
MVSSQLEHFFVSTRPGFSGGTCVSHRRISCVEQIHLSVNYIAIHAVSSDKDELAIRWLHDEV